MKKLKLKQGFVWFGFALIIFAFVFGVSYALIEVANSTISNINTKSLKVSIVEDYEEPEEVLPSSIITKVVDAKNTGEIEVFVRAKVTKVWGDKDDSGSIVVDPSLETDNIVVYYNNTYWVDGKDGYFYYKGILKPNQITKEPLLTDFSIASSTDNRYQGKAADIIVELEAIQTTGGAVGDLWGKTYEFLEVEEPKTKDYGKTVVTYLSPSKQFDIRTNPIDLFVNFKDLEPGVSRSQIVTLKNDYKRAQGFGLKAEVTKQDESYDEELIYDLIDKYVNIEIYDGDSLLYNGPIWGNLDDNSNNMRDYTVPSNNSKDLLIKLSVSKDMGNEYQNLLAYIKWTFKTVYTDPTLLVHHYLYGTSYRLANDEHHNGTYGWTYETTPNAKLLEKYELVGMPDNASGVYDDEEIEITYYYRIIEPEYEKPSIVKDGTEFIAVDDRSELVYVEGQDVLEKFAISEKITYSITINEYRGNAKITITDKLPQKITGQSILDGGVYDEKSNTITWVEDVFVDTYANNGPITLTFVKNVKLYYKRYVRNMTDIATGDIKFDNGSDVPEVNDTHTTVVDIDSLVLVHHYLENTTTSVFDDELLRGIVGDPYETFAKESYKYEVVGIPDNASGEFLDDDIVVIYYYRLREPIEENEVSKIGLDVLKHFDDTFEYTVAYNLKISHYKGLVTIKLVDYLPYAIDYEASNLDDGIYDDEKKTITWTYEIDVDSLEADYTQYIQKNIIVKFLDIDYTKDIVNKVKSTLKYNDKEITDDDEVVTDIDLNARIIVNHYYKDTTNKLTDSLEYSVKIGDKYKTSYSKEVEKKGYRIVSVVGIEKGIADKEEIVVNYYYEKVENPYTGDQITMYVVSFVIAVVVLIAVCLTFTYLNKGTLLNIKNKHNNIR